MKNKTKEIKADWEKEFDREFCIDHIKTFFGNVEELKKDGWEVGGNQELIMKQNIKVEKLKDYIKKNFVAKGDLKQLTEDYEHYINSQMGGFVTTDEQYRQITKMRRDHLLLLGFLDFVESKLKS